MVHESMGWDVSPSTFPLFKFGFRVSSLGLETPGFRLFTALLFVWFHSFGNMLLTECQVARNISNIPNRKPPGDGLDSLLSTQLWWIVRLALLVLWAPHTVQVILFARINMLGSSCSGGCPDFLGGSAPRFDTVKTGISGFCGPLT